MSIALRDLSKTFAGWEPELKNIEIKYKTDERE